MQEIITDFFLEYWWAILGATFMVCFLIYQEYKYQNDTPKNENNTIKINVILIISLIIPLFIINAIKEEFYQDIFGAIYLFYIGLLFILSYFYPKHNFIFRSFHAFSILQPFKLEIWTFIFGLIFCIGSLAMLFITVIDKN